MLYKSSAFVNVAQPAGLVVEVLGLGIGAPMASGPLVVMFVLGRVNAPVDICAVSSKEGLLVALSMPVGAVDIALVALVSPSCCIGRAGA